MITIYRGVRSFAGALAAGVLFTITSGAFAQPEPVPATSPPENRLLTFFKNTELSGSVDAYYSYNFNRPATPCADVGGVKIYNCLRNFDVADKSASLNLAEAVLQKTPTTNSRGGFRIDLDYGSATKIVHGTNRSEFLYRNIQQAYLSYLAPAGKGKVAVDLGKFVTPMGFETIETKDNWNYSRSLLFALAIPYYHAGLRATYTPNDKVSVAGFLLNGWNHMVNGSGGKTAAIQVVASPSSAFTVIENYMAGPATPHATWRHLSDTVLTYTASKKATVALNYDFGRDTNTNQTWSGAAVYLRYQPTDTFALVPRFEVLKDRDRFMTGVPQTMRELTLTAEVRRKGGVTTRIEYRNDFAGVNDYFIKSVGFTKKQPSLTIGWVYAFSNKTP